MASRGGLGDLLAKAGVPVSPEPTSPPAAATRTPAAATPAPPDFDLSRSAKIVLRRERKGRGGKTATVVGGLGLAAPALDALARALRAALGCGGHVEGDTVVLHGDLVGRAEPWLAAHGARRIVVGN